MAYLKISSAPYVIAPPVADITVEGLKPYYRRRLPNGMVKVWLKKGQEKIEMEMTAEAAALLPPNKAVRLNYS